MAVLKWSEAKYDSIDWNVSAREDGAIDVSDKDELLYDPANLAEYEREKNDCFRKRSEARRIKDEHYMMMAMTTITAADHLSANGFLTQAKMGAPGKIGHKHFLHHRHEVETDE